MKLTEKMIKVRVILPENCSKFIENTIIYLLYDRLKNYNNFSLKISIDREVYSKIFSSISIYLSSIYYEASKSCISLIDKELIRIEDKVNNLLKSKDFTAFKTMNGGLIE